MRRESSSISMKADSSTITVLPNTSISVPHNRGLIIANDRDICKSLRYKKLCVKNKVLYII